jgi:hypothetical protein
MQAFTSVGVLQIDMAEYKIKCVNIDRSSDHDDCRCIESIGFPGRNTDTVTKPPATVYDWVENEGHTVVVEHNGSETEVHGATHGGTKYVRTDPNDTKEDNLLKQPNCSYK